MCLTRGLISRWSDEFLCFPPPPPLDVGSSLAELKQLTVECGSNHIGDFIGLVLVAANAVAACEVGELHAGLLKT